MDGVSRGKAYLADELHITVLDTVVDHLDKVTGTLITDPVAAGLVVALGSDALEDIFDVGPGLLVTTGHERGAVAGTLLTTGDTTADKADALRGELLGSAVAIGEVGVATIDDDITLLEVGQESLDELIDGLAGHDQEHDTARTLQLGAKLLDGVSTDDGLAWRSSVNHSRLHPKRAMGRKGSSPLASLSRKRSTLEVVRLYAQTVKP